jgi:hypothetical protein
MAVLLLALALSVAAAFEELLPFTATCLSSTQAIDPASGESYECAAGMVCSCARYLAADDTWNCLGDEVACRSIPHTTPRYPTNSFQATLVSSVYDGQSLINITSVHFRCHTCEAPRPRADPLTARARSAGTDVDP